MHPGKNQNRSFISAENIAKEFNISREEQDEYAAESQQRAEEAIAKGYFDKEIVTVPVSVRRETINVSKDEFPKAGTTAEQLGKLRPAFLQV